MEPIKEDDNKSSLKNSSNLVKNLIKVKLTVDNIDKSHTNGTESDNSQPNKCPSITKEKVNDKIDISKVSQSRQTSVKETANESRSSSAKRKISNGSGSDNDSPEKSKPKRLHSVSYVNGVEKVDELSSDISKVIKVVVEVSSNELKSAAVNGTETVQNGTVNVVDSEAKSDSINSPEPSSLHCTTATDTEQTDECNVAVAAEVCSKSAAASNVATDADMLTDIELLLTSKFGVSEQQGREVFSLLPQHIQDEGSVSAGTVSELVWCLLRNTSTLSAVSSPRCNKLIRQLLDHYCSMEQPKVDDKHALCQECVKWAREQHRTALCQELEVSLMTLYASTGHWRQAQQTALALYTTTKHMQDKEKTIKACLCLSQSYHAMSNLCKARAFITTAKTEALKIYTPPDLQAQLDLQSGILQVAEGKDLETAVSYFKEAATCSPISKHRSRALKYLVLGCLLMDRPSDGKKAAHTPTHLKDIDEGVLAMLAVVDSATTASVQKFRAAREKYKTELEDDSVVAPVLDQLYIEMMEKNIKNIILPYKRVQIQHIADTIELPRLEVERRLSQMILDGSLSGQLDHRDHCLYLYPSETKDPVYSATIDTIACLEKTIVHLNKKAVKLMLAV
uniref:26S proteasome non-ATPase regulatory subunit 11 n=1 Tax=Hirondellea gigas TaxID=1518452 RepID=A0A2P2HXM2_9CRUS